MSMRRIYRKIAKAYGVSVAEVKGEMQAAIAYAYQKNEKSERENRLQKQIPSKQEVPTSEELVRAVAQQVKNRARNVPSK